MPIDFGEMAKVNLAADEAFRKILSKRYDTPDMYAEISKIDDLRVAKLVIRRLLDKLNGVEGP